MIRIVTDTDSNLSQELVDEYDLGFVPIHVIFENEVLREHFEITPETAFERMEAGRELPTTSQPPVGEFKEAYASILADGDVDTILSIHVSSKLSGTIESARHAAALFPDADIQTFDTLTASLGQGLMVVEAAKMARAGASVNEIIARLEIMRDNMQSFFIVRSLENLAKGGRIGLASHLMGNLLEIKPVLYVVDGVVDSHSRCRTWSRAISTLEQIVVDHVKNAAHGSLQLSVMHAANDEEGARLADDLCDALNPEVFLYGEIGPGLGVHLGRGALGVCWTRLP